MSLEYEDESEEDSLVLAKGLILTTGRNTYIVQNLLAEGTFGAIYKVAEKQRPSDIRAMKIEKNIEDRTRSKLRTEIMILQRLGGKTHFPILFDTGTQETFTFLIMELLGKNLADLKKVRPHEVFSLATGLSVSCQCLEACRELHYAGYVHRDVKPANFVCGRGKKLRTIYMLDFGISKKLVPVSKEDLSQGRRFRGTIRYASIPCHMCEELGPRDDCESWLYMMVDLLSPLSVPWRNAGHRNVVLRIKQEVRRDKRDLFVCGIKCKKSILAIMDYIDTLKRMTPVDYAFMLEAIEKDARRLKCNLTAPYDWETDCQNESRKSRSTDKTANVIREEGTQQSEERMELLGPASSEESQMLGTSTQNTQSD
ncbi:unnamed protein product [Cylicocyclus nassatus]|uniref:non-specific serine/threonine protein kinase n=1 Tax=Cylicocyclus nassatus TaxID=53992 RepID=A0AA36H510_CYLNA|nr:unnamed protein product [Cylicocyclus nassatus]